MIRTSASDTASSASTPHYSPAEAWGDQALVTAKLIQLLLADVHPTPLESILRQTDDEELLVQTLLTWTRAAYAYFNATTNTDWSKAKRVEALGFVYTLLESGERPEPDGPTLLSPDDLTALTRACTAALR